MASIGILSLHTPISNNFVAIKLFSSKLFSSLAEPNNNYLYLKYAAISLDIARHSTKNTFPSWLPWNLQQGREAEEFKAEYIVQ